jgi:hypothetical protein|tara:strand:- start:223 stop:477 length:255 start_codon:yes stop_codon:yes gene_type:complete
LLQGFTQPKARGVKPPNPSQSLTLIRSGDAGEGKGTAAFLHLNRLRKHLKGSRFTQVLLQESHSFRVHIIDLALLQQDTFLQRP